MSIKVQLGICKVCGKSFERQRVSGFYCSQKCKNTAFKKKCQKVTKICPICGKVFKTKKSKPNITCSRQCGVKMANIKRLNNKNTSSGIPTTALCWTCKRAYARPDPEGCAWIRNHVKVWDEAKPVVLVTSKKPGSITGYMVRKCKFYVQSQDRMVGAG